MKNYIPNSVGGLLLIFSAMLFQTACISDVSDPNPPLDPNTTLERATDYPEAFSLENLRMDSETNKMLAGLRAATAKYHRIEVAMDNGYVLPEGSGCVSTPSGGMGYHYVNSAALDGEYDPTMPEALLYEMGKNGKMKLVGVEFVVVADDWDAENEMIPYFGMQEFDKAYPPAPLPFRNYQLHVWVWKHNPNGIFTMFNPNVTCE